MTSTVWLTCGVILLAVISVVARHVLVARIRAGRISLKRGVVITVLLLYVLIPILVVISGGNITLFILVYAVFRVAWIISTHWLLPVFRRRFWTDSNSRRNR